MERGKNAGTQVGKSAEAARVGMQFHRGFMDTKVKNAADIKLELVDWEKRNRS